MKKKIFAVGLSAAIAMSCAAMSVSAVGLGNSSMSIPFSMYEDQSTVIGVKVQSVHGEITVRAEIHENALPAGNYRLLLSITSDKDVGGDGGYHIFNIVCPFTIE